MARRCDSLDLGQRSAASEAGPREDTALVFADECGGYCTPRPIQGFYIPRSTARRYEFSEPAGRGGPGADLRWPYIDTDHTDSV